MLIRKGLRYYSINKCSFIVKIGGMQLDKVDTVVDHTSRLEQRLRAVQIYANDTCSFFLPRDENAINLQRCHYCAYAKFETEVIEEDTKGLCKFKP